MDSYNKKIERKDEKMLKKIKLLKKKNEKLETEKCNMKKEKALKKEKKAKLNDDLNKNINNEDSKNKVLSNNQNIIKKMSRKDLLQLLIVQRNKIDELESEIVQLKELLTSKEITIKNAGSIAEASLKLNKVFEKAQEAANQYLENIKKSKKK